MEEREEMGGSRFGDWAPYLGALGIALIAAAIFLELFLQTRRDVLLMLVGVGIVLLFIFFRTRPREELRQAVTGRTAVYGSNSLILSVAFVGIVVLVNFLASKQLHSRVDLTAGKQHTLSEQTLQVLQNLKDPVQVTGFFTSRPGMETSRKSAEDQLREYQLRTNKLTVKFIDPDENPAAARNYEIAQDGTLVFERGDRKEKVYEFNESSFTNAILKVTQTQQPVVYFKTGHGENSPTDFEQGGMGSVRDPLQQINYKVEILNLAAVTSTQTISGGLPADISALVIAGPRKAFSADEEQRIKTYLDHGGRVLIMVDSQAVEPKADPGLKDLFAAWGITLNNDLVLEMNPASNLGGRPAIPLITSFPSHDVTKNLDRFGGVFFPGARSIKVAENNDKTSQALFTTSPDSCTKTDFQALESEQQVQCDWSKDPKGPFTLGYALQGTPPNNAGANAKQSRLIVIGNATFATNAILTSQNSLANGYLFGNMINWLAGQEQLIAIPARDPQTHPLTTLSGSDINLFLWSNIALIPLITLILGGLIWWRRR